MFLNDQSRRLGDFAAGTLVVREGQKISLTQLSRARPSPVALSKQAQSDAATLPINRLSRDQQQLVSDFLTRRATMPDAQRARLALQIGQTVAQQMDVVPPIHPSEAEYLLELVAGATIP